MNESRQRRFRVSRRTHRRRRATVFYNARTRKEIFSLRQKLNYIPLNYDVVTRYIMFELPNIIVGFNKWIANMTYEVPRLANAIAYLYLTEWGLNLGQNDEQCDYTPSPKT